MMTPPATNLGVKNLTPALIRQLLLWIPIIGGLVHQFVMFFGPGLLGGGEGAQAEPLIDFNFDCMPVFLDPPGYLKPIVTLGYQWWLVLLLLSTVVCILAYAERIRAFPSRLVFPFYIYILFLLIFVKPVSNGGGEPPAQCGPEAEEVPPAASVIMWDIPFSS
jgi:hypothetical protein